MSLDILLKILADGEFHSGDEIGQKLGITRAAVWKQLKKLEHLNLPLTSVKGKGYQIDGGLDLLAGKAIHGHLQKKTRGLISRLDVKGMVESTNDLAMVEALARHTGYVCVAEGQTAGRGRRGNTWVSPYAGNIYLSIVWEFDEGAASLEGLSLATGVALVAALTETGLRNLNLKWPNDVLASGKKLGGVLTEITGDAAGPCQVVLGIGLNVRMPADVSSSIGQPWTDVSTQLEAPVSRNQLVATLLNHVMPMLQSFSEKGFSAYQKQWESLDSLAKQQVELNVGGQLITGRAMGVDTSGALIVESRGGRQLFRGGEVSLRGSRKS